MLTAIRQWVIRTMMKSRGETGIVQTMPKKDLVELNTQITAQRLMQSGIDPQSLKNADQVENAIIAIESRPKVQEGIQSTQSAKVFDLEGKEIKNPKNIMGGKEVKETEAEMLARINEENKKGIEGLKQKMKKEQARSKRISGTLRESNRERFDRIQFGEEKKGPPVKDVDYDYYRELLDYQGDEFSDDISYVVGDETKEMLEAMVKEQKDEMAYMKRLYDKGALDPEDMAQGGRAGFKTGLTPSFEDYLKERNMIEKRKRLEQLMREYQDDLERKKVMQQKQEAKEGGRIGFKDGMTRRTFLKLLGGMAAVPIVGKFFKLSKVGQKVKQVPVIKTDDVAGKPEWFDALVNKVITEGDDVTKRFATGERQSIHQKTLDDGSVVRVTEDVDEGAVRVEYESEANVFGDDVLMEYKKPLPDEGDPRPAAEFTTAESGPVGRSSGPDDYEIEVDEVGGSSIRDLDSDVSKLKEYATGKKPTMKELVQNIERRKKAQRITDDPEAQSDAVTRRQGDFIQFDDIDPDPGDFASGGIARMLGE